MTSQMIFEQSIVINPDNNFINKNVNRLENVQSNSSEIIPTIVTRQEVEILVKSTISSEADIIDYKLQRYSDEKIGFLGTHLQLIVQVKKSNYNEYERRSFFVKTIPYNIPAQAEYVKEKGVFKKEIQFFKDLVPLLTKNFKGDTWSPHCYLTKESTIIFEDLKFKGFTNRSKLFDKETLLSAVACIARFHASSLLAEEQLNGKSLIQLYPELMQESEFQLTGSSYTWFITAINLAVSLAKNLELDASAIYKASERIFDIRLPSQNKRNVVSHGDLWSYNILFDKNNRCNLVDFQLVRYAPLAHDVMQLLYLTTSKELRQKCESEVIKYYYATLIEHLKINDFHSSLPTFEEVLEGAEEQRLLALITAIIFHPTVLMDGITAARIMDNPITYEAYYFKDRKPFVDKIMAEDPVYKQKLIETVEELVEMSLILDSLPRPK
ncbi:PREDICTED: uncharacterized protein LOC105366188 [Ceratosolen solmsi marchali]|uniref:Uncharacterized protein LOC105366188 n=1 Tax=Ceratosolen solmsi marchali TaxID=326594 RepID=A0AAJ6YRB8_9HYME|nr:PREDICTED: uncharacterized protein LOC105366188 [Ceratosolen solmsi marchali]